MTTKYQQSQQLSIKEIEISPITTKTMLKRRLNYNYKTKNIYLEADQSGDPLKLTPENRKPQT